MHTVILDTTKLVWLFSFGWYPFLSTAVLLVCALNLYSWIKTFANRMAIWPILLLDFGALSGLLLVPCVSLLRWHVEIANAGIRPPIDEFYHSGQVLGTLGLLTVMLVLCLVTSVLGAVSLLRVPKDFDKAD